MADKPAPNTLHLLFLEIQQLTGLKTPREEELEDLLRSAHAIAERRGKDTRWEAFCRRLSEAGIHPITPKTFRICPGEDEP